MNAVLLIAAAGVIALLYRAFDAMLPRRGFLVLLEER